MSGVYEDSRLSVLICIGGLKISLAGAEAKLAQIDQITTQRNHTIQLGIPSFTDAADRTITTSTTPPNRP